MQSRAAWFAILLPGALTAQNPFAGNATAADIGRAAFRSICAPCHGIKARGGRGPDLTLGIYDAGNKDEDLFRVISNGISGTEMPAFGVTSGDDNVWRIVTYIRSVATHQAVPAKGNAAAGETLFWGRGNCGACHRVGAKGGPMGPDLSRAGRQRSLAYLRDSLLDPNADLTPRFYKITVVTRDGRKITGTQRGFDNFSAQLMTMDGSLHSFQRDEVTACDREYVSLMPAYNSLAESEINDLLAYLVTLRGEVQ